MPTDPLSRFYHLSLRDLDGRHAEFLRLDGVEALRDEFIGHQDGLTLTNFGAPRGILIL